MPEPEQAAAPADAATMTAADEVGSKVASSAISAGLELAAEQQATEEEVAVAVN